MKETGERCLWLAFVAAVPVGTLLSLTMEMSVLTSVLIGLVTMTLLVGAALGVWAWQYVRRLHRQTRNWVLTVVGMGVPEHYFPAWLEEMQAQLHWARGEHRRSFLPNLLRTAVRNWWDLGWSRLRYLRASRFRGNEINLGWHLVMVLAPDGARSSRGDLLHAIGVSRLHNRRAAHNVPALRLVQQLLATESEHFHAARGLATRLLDTREHIHLMTREVLCRPRQGHPPHSSRYDELDRLRDQALDQSRALRTALVVGLARELT